MQENSINEGLFSFIHGLFTKAKFDKESLKIKKEGEDIVGLDSLEESIDAKDLRFKKFRKFKGQSVRDIADAVLGDSTISSSKLLKTYLTLLFRELMLEEEYYKGTIALKQLKKSQQRGLPEYDELKTRTEILYERTKNAKEALRKAKTSNIEFIENKFDNFVNDLKKLAEKYHDKPKRVKELVAIKDILLNRFNLIKVALTNLEADVRQALIPSEDISKDPLFKDLEKFKNEFIESNKQATESISKLEIPIEKKEGPTEKKEVPTEKKEEAPRASINDLKEQIDITNKNIIIIKKSIRQKENIINSANITKKEKEKIQVEISGLNKRLKEEEQNLNTDINKLNTVVKPTDTSKYVEELKKQKELIFKLETQLKQKEDETKKKELEKVTKQAEETVENFVTFTIKDAVNKPEVNKAKNIKDSEILSKAKTKLIKAGFDEKLVEDALKKVINSKQPFKSMADLIKLTVDTL